MKPRPSITTRAGSPIRKVRATEEAQAPSGYRKPENPGPWKEPLSPASNRVKKAENIARVWAVEQVIAVDCPVSVVASEMTKDALFDASTYARRWASEQSASERTTRLSPQPTPLSLPHHYASRRAANTTEVNRRPGRTLRAKLEEGGGRRRRNQEKWKGESRAAITPCLHG